MTELMRGNGRSESSSAEGSAAQGGSPRGAEPTAARETSAAAAAAAAGGVARGDTIAGRETTLREDASRNFGVTGRRGAAVSVDVGPARGQPDSHGGLENGMHTQAVSWVVVMICLSVAIRRLSTPLYHRLEG